MACEVNETMLDMNSRCLMAAVLEGDVVDREMIKNNLNFARPSSKKIEWGEGDFQKKLEYASVVRREVLRKLGHDRCEIFIDEIQKLFLDAKDVGEKYAIYELLWSTMSKLQGEVQMISDVDPDCWIPGEQLSFVSNTTHTTPTHSEGHLSSSNSSESGKDNVTGSEVHRSSGFHERESNTKRTNVDLGRLSTNKNSPLFYGIWVEDAKNPLRVLCDLSRFRVDALDSLIATIQDVEQRAELVHGLKELVFSRGSSRKFNKLFPFLKGFVEKYKQQEKPLIVVFSTTSESQQSCKALYTLGHAHPVQMVALQEEGVLKSSRLEPIIISTDFSDQDRETIASSMGINPLLEGQQ